MGMDLIGPLLTHTYWCCRTTKWPEAIPLKDTTTKSVPGVLLSVILKWGPPAELIGNQGPEFVAELNQELLRQWGMKRQYSSTNDLLVDLVLSSIPIKSEDDEAIQSATFRSQTIPPSTIDRCTVSQLIS